MEYKKPNWLYYKIAQIASFIVATFIFKRRMLRNELAGVKGPYVVIANHQAALDFVNLIGVVRRRMTFVISHSFYNSLPIKGILNRLQVIPKQQFQTTVRDMKRMKAVIDAGQPLVIYPAGLMCEDGLSTPIPKATYKFLKWLGADVYVARTTGTYFSMPKWGKGLRPGRTYLDVYQLFTKEQLADASVEQVKERTDRALLFDAYREQEELRIKYKNNNQIAGLENVLYMCPHCRTEYSVQVKDGHTFYCTRCGFAHKSDAYGFLKNLGSGEEIRYVSDWSRRIYNTLKQKMQSGEHTVLESPTKIHMIDGKKNKFAQVGQGVLTLSNGRFALQGQIHGQPVELSISTINYASLPFSPGKYLELQQGEHIYRCVLEDGRLVMKFINMVKIFYELQTAAQTVK